MQELLAAKRPIAASEFARNLVNVLKARLPYEERYTEGKIIRHQVLLYQILHACDGDPEERWQVISDAKYRVEKISPDSWEDQSMRSLREERMQILQYYVTELHTRNPILDESIISKQISVHEEILALQAGKEDSTGYEVRLASLRAICDLKERLDEENHYWLYAEELYRLAWKKFDGALLANELTLLGAYQWLWSHITISKGYIRAGKWERAMDTATKGIEAISSQRWKPTEAPHLERSQLLILRSNCSLKLGRPVDARKDAQDALEEADLIPWNKSHPDKRIDAEYPRHYGKHHFQNEARLHLIDIQYDRLAGLPEEEFGLFEARKGIQHTINSTASNITNESFEVRLRRKEIRALRRLGRWLDVIVACDGLLTKATNELESSNDAMAVELADYILDTCEDAADCLQKLQRNDLAYKLQEATDSYADSLNKKRSSKQTFIKSKALTNLFGELYALVTPAAEPEVKGADLSSSKRPQLCRAALK